MVTYAFIPARSGSSRIQDKNVQKVGGRPLVQTAMRCSHMAGSDCVVVSTDDVGSVDRVLGWWNLCQYHERPDSLAGPNAQIEPAIEHWGRRADLLDDDVICLVQPTSPFRRPESIRACVDAVQSGKAPTALTVTRFERLPFLGRKLTDDGRSLWERPRGWTRPRSQDVRHVPEEAGSVYVFTWRHLKRTGSRMCDRPAVVEVDRFEALEIDTPADLELARVLAPHVEDLRRMEEERGSE